MEKPGVGPVADEAATHAWYIEEREYLRQESRRGRRHAYERLTPARTALIVIDMVPFFALENRYAGASYPTSTGWPVRCVPRAGSWCGCYPAATAAARGTTDCGRVRRDKAATSA
jgi:hypothetical protein